MLAQAPSSETLALRRSLPYWGTLACAWLRSRCCLEVIGNLLSKLHPAFSSSDWAVASTKRAVLSFFAFRKLSGFAQTSSPCWTAISRYLHLVILYERNLWLFSSLGGPSAKDSSTSCLKRRPWWAWSLWIWLVSSVSFVSDQKRYLAQATICRERLGPTCCHDGAYYKAPAR